MTVASLLPSHSTDPYEYALAAGLTDVLSIPYATLMDPYQTRAELLPWLAAHYSVDLWFDDWPEARKREAVAQAAGVSTLFPASPIGELKGTRSGTSRFLALVNGTILDVVSHPQRVILNRTSWRRAPVGHPAFAARHLVKVTTARPPRSWVAGRGVLGRARVKTHSREEIERCMKAMRVAKAETSEYRVDFAHKRMISINDNIDIDGGFSLGEYVDRVRL